LIIAFGAGMPLNKLQKITYQRSEGIFAVCVMDLLGIEECRGDGDGAESTTDVIAKGARAVTM
jgi:hypothetical protein